MQTLYLAPEGLEHWLREELTGVTAQYGRLLLADGPPQNVHWVQNIWYEAELIPITSISDGAKKLKQRGKLWAFYPLDHMRRGHLIQEQLSYFSPKPLIFPSPLPKSPLGSWTLLDEHTIIASSHCQSPFAHGACHFEESRFPPSRAYLKLWEALTRLGKWPEKGDHCLEVGASPGSWTWALQQLGAQVTAVDRAPLDPAIAALPHITCKKGDAFAIKPSDYPDVTWIFSDVICYPEKLLEWLKEWLSSGRSLNYVCTLKFQGSFSKEIIDAFESIEGSQLIHLFHNKHELTWIYPANSII